MTDSLKLIRGGNLVFSTGIIQADLLISGEKISAIGVPGSFAGAEGADVA